MRTAAVLVALLSVSSPAFAVDKAAARVAYERATKLYDLNQFGDALEEFKKAYLAFDDPAFLFNIAQCHRQLGNNAEAVKFYRSYLRKVPEAPNADEVRKLIGTLEETIEREKRAAPPAVTAPPPPTATSPTTTPAVMATTSSANIKTSRAPAYKKWWVWTIVGVAAAGAATGIALAVTQSQANEATFSPVHVQ